MRVPYLSKTAFRIFTALKKPASRITLMGCLCGFYLLAFCHQFLATFGTSLPAVTALAIAMALGIECGFKQRVPAFIRFKDTSSLFLLLHVGLAIWTLVFPWMMGLAISLAGQIPVEVMAVPGRAILFQILVAIGLISLPVFAIGQLPGVVHQLIDSPKEHTEQDSGPSQTAHKSKTQRNLKIYEQYLPTEQSPFRRWWKAIKTKFRRRTRIQPEFTPRYVARRYLQGIAIGLVTGVLAIAPLLSIQAAAFTAIIGSLSIVAFLGYRFLFSDVQTSTIAATEIEHSPQNSATVDDSNQSNNRTSFLGIILNRSTINSSWTWIAVACLGGIHAVVRHMADQLAATSSYLVYMEWTAILAGVTVGFICSNRIVNPDEQSPNRPVDTAVSAAWFSASWGALILVSYAWLTELSLMCSAFVGQPWLTITFRCLLATAIFFPLGWGWGRISSSPALESNPQNNQHSEARSSFPDPRIFTFCTGYLAMQWMAIPQWSIATLLVFLVGCLAVLAAGRWGMNRQIVEPKTTLFPKTHRRRLALAASLAVLIAAPFLRGQYDPAKTARQLFATNVFIARMKGLDPRMLSYLDEGRLIASEQGERGTLTVWRYRGHLLQIRENGVPKAIVSTKTRYCPQFTAEIMQAIIPLVLHDQPERIMILGMGGGVPLVTSLAFPVAHVTCVESDQALVSLLQKTVWKESGNKPFQDERFRYLPLDPAVAVACRAANYDVVISSPDQSALLQATPYFTQRFYSGVSRQLSQNGIFCQRFHQVDYGPIAMQTAVKTLQSVFRNVVAIEIASGEMALMATNSEKGFSRDGLVSRFQAPHVRRALSEIGWDWSLPLNLTAFSNEGLREFSSATPTHVNTTANGRLAFRLPQEMMRWAPKGQELLALLAPHGSRLAESGKVASNDPDLLRRISEVTGQRKLMIDYPDQWWAYRKSLKEQIRQRPRTLIQKVSEKSSKGRIHPEDRRRMRYIATLDRAVKDPVLTAIQRISRYEEPYDPLLSYFVHQEAAELYSRAEEKDYAEELRHRLHAVYFAHPQDRSVRNVASAMKLLAEQKTSVESPMQRWDQLNSLLQLMKGRWKFRGLVKPKSVQIVMNDIDRCLEAIELSMTTMDSLRGQIDISSQVWKSRRTVLEQGLVRPLRTYRRNLLSHHLNEKRRLKKLLESLDNPPDENPSSSPKDGNVVPPVAN